MVKKIIMIFILTLINIIPILGKDTIKIKTNNNENIIALHNQLIKKDDLLYLPVIEVADKTGLNITYDKQTGRTILAHPEGIYSRIFEISPNLATYFEGAGKTADSMTIEGNKIEQEYLFKSPFIHDNILYAPVELFNDIFRANIYEIDSKHDNSIPKKELEVIFNLLSYIPPNAEYDVFSNLENNLYPLGLYITSFQDEIENTFNEKYGIKKSDDYEYTLNKYNAEQLYKDLFGVEVTFETWSSFTTKHEAHPWDFVEMQITEYEAIIYAPIINTPVILNNIFKVEKVTLLDENLYQLEINKYSTDDDPNKVLCSYIILAKKDNDKYIPLSINSEDIFYENQDLTMYIEYKL
ncbi:hypothetical protein AN640_06360 [Candidatus Epulonipiscium fishelsonii]|uniref:Uncharacterized protein n=1 Tax=Candidatus Epulonipiscium fishelsonii TaxID=77094 RepID=A0ACC8XHI0_9FIRM|nr:hypothetical protein AN640_06360 [Epulopiscium sp. SCG-D08WGA-EpuloA1]OON94409.1 MAG: hypothetical protein ATN32_08250 [Epulopiscium sp. AS2M-Bin002]